MPQMRLFDKSQGDSQWIVIPEEHRYPLSSATGRWGLAVCLQSALKSAGTDVDYARLMALLNIAFTLNLDPQFRPEVVIEGACRRVKKALSGLGFADASLADGTPEEERTVREIERGRPFLVEQWDDATRDWSLIFGVGPHVHRWRGYLFAPHEGHMEMPAACSRAIILGARKPALPEEQIEREAIEDAVQWFDENGSRAYEEWAKLVSIGQVFSRGPAGDERILGHEWFTEAHLDARDAAVQFFRDLAHTYPAMMETFAGIADSFGRVVETLENRRPPIFSDMATRMLRDPDVTSEWTNRLQQAGQLEQDAMRQMQDTLRMSWM